MREEKKRSSQRTMQDFFKKRWVFPAIYLVCAAMIISAVVWYQNSINNAAKDSKYGYENAKGPKDKETPSVEVNQAIENIAMPVKNADDVVYAKKFYDPAASLEEQEAALVVVGNSYRPNQGVDIANKDGKEFNVLAALSGKVTAVREDALLGNVIEISHENGIVTQYQALKDMKVKAGDEVKQGQAIALSGTSELNKEAGIHVHFELRKDSEALNPLEYFGKPLTALSEQTTGYEVPESSGIDKDAETGKQSDEKKAGESSDSSKAAEETDAKDSNKK